MTEEASWLIHLFQRKDEQWHRGWGKEKEKNPNRKKPKKVECVQYLGELNS